MANQKFQEAYQQLNPAQKEAVDTIEGPVLVSAGPGTGKTQILALRIANILVQTDTRPENILALTFTESGVLAMRKRLREIIGNPAYRVVINTFHGFCNEIIRNRPEDFPTIIGAVNITEVDQIKVLEEVFSELNLNRLTTFGDPFYYLKEAKNAIGQLKQEGVSPAKLASELKKIESEFWQIEDLYSTKKGYEGKLKTKYTEELKRIEKNQELVLVYETYEKKLREYKYYDYSDMISQTFEALKTDPDLLLSLQETYQYILVDEHQDTNNAQNGILEKLADFYDQPNLFVVGDDKQAIFRFQGASLENFLYFKNKYPSAKLIILENNYRSSQVILDLAHSLLAGDKKLTTQTKHLNERVKLAELSRVEVEDYFVAKDIASKISAGVKPEEIAIIYRDNQDAFSVSAMLSKEGVPFSIESNQDLLDDQEVNKLIKILRAVNNFGDSRALIETLHLRFLDIEAFDVFKFTEAVGREKINAYEAGKNLTYLKKLGLAGAVKINNWYLKLAEFNRLASELDVVVLFETVLRDSGLLAEILNSPGNVEKIERINALFDEAQALLEKKRNAKLTDFMDYLEMLEKHEIRLKKNSDGVRAGRVRLMTAHGSKGLEFDYVYIIYVNDKHWGNKTHRELIKLPSQIFSLVGNNLDQTEALDDERRLFYVALTRARKGLTISYSRQGKNLKELLPSIFVTELDPLLSEKLNLDQLETEVSAWPDLRYRAGKVEALDIRNQEFVRALFSARGFSVTHLNNYLTCPWKYFYMNLLRLPKALARHLLYGTAIHAALCDFFDQFKDNNESATKEFLLLAFERSLARQALPAEEYPDFKKRGEKALAGYYDHYHDSWRTNVLTEFDIKGIILKTDSAKPTEIVLTGKIDKLEFLGTGNEVNVVDYKTGQTKSRSKIEGDDDSDDESEGSLKRQLAFYKLLLDHYDNGRYQMVSGDIDFIEPNSSGKYKKESFIVSDQEIADLETLIKRVADEIISVAFWDKRCDNSQCEFCQLRETMGN